MTGAPPSVPNLDWPLQRGVQTAWFTRSPCLDLLGQQRRCGTIEAFRFRITARPPRVRSATSFATASPPFLPPGPRRM